MQPRFLSLALVLYATSSSAQEDLLACVDPDVRAGILATSVPVGADVTREVPDYVGELGELVEFEFIASVAYSARTAAAFKTDLPAPDSIERMTAILQQAGWRDEHRGEGQGGGFVVESEVQTRLLCRDSERAYMVLHPSGDNLYMTVAFMPLSPFLSTCDELVLTPPETRVTPGTDFRRHLPRLTLPEDGTTMARQIQSPSGGRFTGDASVSLETELSAQELVDHFETQLQNQGWRYDAGWSAQSSNGSVWNGSPVEDVRLTGLLEVVSVDGFGYHAVFRVISLD